MVGELPETRSRGGDGSDIDGYDASVVPLLQEDDDGVQGDEAKLVARWWSLASPVPPGIVRRSWSGRRTASVDDARVDPVREKMPNLVKKVCKGERK